MSKPAQKPDILRFFMLFAVIFLGYQLITQGLNPQKTVRPAEQIIANMLMLNEQVRDITIAKELGEYKSAIDAESKVPGAKITPEELAKLKLTATLLVADTQYKAGTRLDDTTRLTAGYQLLHDNRKEFEKFQMWTTPVSVKPVTGLFKEADNGPSVNKDPDGKFLRTTVKPNELYEEIKVDLSTMLREQPVIGFIPGYDLIDALVKMTGAVPGFSYAFAAFLLAFIVRMVVWPLYLKQMMFGRQMSQLSPLVKELQAKYKENPQELQVKTMALYKEYGINPMAGCFPALLQLPLFLVIYQCMVHYRFEFTYGTFLWVNPAISAQTNAWTAPNLGEQDYLMVFIYAVAMVASSLLMPVTDPTNAKQQKLIAVMMGVMFAVFMFFMPVPSAFVLYWIFTILVSTAQSLVAYRLPAPPLVKKNAPHGAVLPVTGVVDTGSKSTGAPQIHKPKKKKR